MYHIFKYIRELSQYVLQKMYGALRFAEVCVGPSKTATKMRKQWVNVIPRWAVELKLYERSKECIQI